MPSEMKNKILTSILFIGISLNAISQDQGAGTLSFSLEEAIEYAWEHNIDIMNADLDIESAKKEVWKTTAIGLPQANGKLDYQHLPGELPTLSFPTSTGELQEIALGVKNSSTYSVTVSQLIFSGEYLVGLRAANTFLQLSENSLLKSRNDTKQNVSSAYYTILLLENTRAVLDSSLQNNRTILEETRAMAETGFLEDTDYEQFTIVTNTIENGIKSLDRQIDLAYSLFKLNLGVTSETEVRITESIDNLLDKVEFSRLLSGEFILENNIDYKILDTNQKLSELNLKREKAKFLPTLSAFYLYQDKTNKPDFDITFNHILGLNLGVPIFSSGQRLASVNQAKIDVVKSINSKNLVSESLKMAVDQARGDFETAYETYLTETDNLKLSKKIYNKTMIKYKEGFASSLDVTQAHNQYLQAVNGYTTAVSDVLNARTSLEIILNK